MLMRFRRAAVCAVAVVVFAGEARAQDGTDGFSQKIAPESPRGSAASGRDAEPAAGHDAEPAAGHDAEPAAGHESGQGAEAPAFTIGVEPTTGAYFRKVTSAPSSAYRGIRAELVLPRPTFDPARWHEPASDEPASAQGPLDVPSVYLGGNAGGHELDAGLTWERVTDEHGDLVWTDRAQGTDGGDPAHRFTFKGALSVVDGRGRERRGAELPAHLVPDFAFRAFYRTTNAGEKQHWHDPAASEALAATFAPGERLVMTVVVAGEARVKLFLRSLDDPAHHFEAAFAQEGFGPGVAASWKRVSSIDQFREVRGADGELRRRGNENGRVIPTRTRVRDMRWESVSLLRAGGGRVPVSGPAFVEARGRDTSAAYTRIFEAKDRTAQGGETLDIVPPSP